MATRTRRPPARRKPARKPVRRSVTITLGPQPRRSPASRRGRSHTWAATRWVLRWGWRGTSWATRQAAGRTAGHARRATAAARMWRTERAAWGWYTPLIHDGSTDMVSDARTARLDSPAVNDAGRDSTDPASRTALRTAQARWLREQQDRDMQARVDRMMRDPGPSRWERMLARLRLRRIDWEAHESSALARVAVLAQRTERLVRLAEPWPEPATTERLNDDPSPVTEPVDLDTLTGRRRHSTRTRGDGSMATSIRQWADLDEPDIDPFDFPEELPGHFAEVAKLLTDEAAMIEAAADSGKQGADTFDTYVEYLNTAGVDKSVISPIVDAREAVAEAVEAIRRATEAMANAATHAEAAQRAAEAAYGDFEMPRFDRANAG